MARIATTYGYDIVLDDDATAMPLLVSPADISQASGGRIAATDPRLPAECAAVSAAIRDYCNWHVAPQLECITETQVDTRIITLPAKFVDRIESIEVDGGEIQSGTYEFKRNGMLRLGYRPCARGKWGAYEITYVAGVDIEATSLRAIATQIALNDLAATPGVRNESVGQVSVSYNQATEGVAGGISLMERDKAMLEGYRIRARA